MAKKKNNSVKRSLYYYDSVWKVYDASKKVFLDVKRKDERFKNFFEKFYFGKSKTVNKRYILPTEKGDNVFVITDYIGDDIINFRIVLCKINALPLIEDEGNLEELEEYIDKKKNIAEITHCVYFRDSGIVGAEFNFSGARLSTLNWYLPKILYLDGDTENFYELKFNPRLHDKAYEKLAENETLTLFEMCFKPSSEAYRNILANKSLFRGAVQSVPDAESIEIIVKRRKNKKNGYTGMTSVLTTEEIKRLINEYRDDISKFYVSQGSYSDGVDMLADKLATKIDIVRTKRRTIDSKDVYLKIRNFYEEEVKP